LEGGRAALSETEARAQLSYAEAIRCGLDDAMAADASIVLLGQDISSGFPFGATSDLLGSYGEQRVRDTPISEAATMGCAIGAAMMGTRTVVEVDFAGFLLLGLDQLVNNAAKLRYMSGGQLRVPLLVRVGQGPLGAFAAQHSQSQHAWLASVPGLALCAASDPQDAYDLLRWALRQRDPVVFAEDMRLYRRKGPLRRGGEADRDVGEDAPRASGQAGGNVGPERGIGVPSNAVDRERVDAPGGDPGPESGIPRARVLRSGREATVLCFGFGTTIALAAARELAVAGIELEVLDLRLLSPLDEQTIGESARHTGRVLCLGDDPLLGGVTATLAATVDRVAHGTLVARLGARHWPTPFGSGERFVYPSADSIVAAVRQLIAWPDRAAHAEIDNGDLQIAGAQ
jgi:acetoin:2,6-dichlorophenolindophenol oxidoreductase subunit beta